MIPSGSRAALREYGQTRAHGLVTDADPHRLVQMLFDGALDAIAQARGHMARGETPEKGAMVSRAINIVDGLRAALNAEAGGDIARNLRDLYDYVENTLLRANVGNDERALDEASALLNEIRGAWAAIAPQA
jgi:flagellar protein FliS